MKNSTPLISIIMPIYNMEKYLPQSIESLVAQTYPNIEIILVDDGSTDSSASICKKYASEHPNIKYIFQENKWLSAARNTGIRNSFGEYLAFIDPDDWEEPDFIEHMFNLMQKENCDLACCEWKWQKPTTKRVKKTKEKILYLTPEETIIEFLSANKITWCVNIKLFKRSALKNLTFDEDIRYAEDCEFSCQFVRQCNKVVLTNQKLYHYIKNESSITNAKFSEKLLSFYNSLDNQIILSKDTKLSSYFKAWKFLVSVEFYYKIIKSKLLDSKYSAIVWEQLKQNYKSFKNHKKEYKSFRRYAGLAYLIFRIFFRPKSSKFKNNI